VIEESDLFVCFLGSPVGEAPRVGIWRAGHESSPIELRSLTPGTRRMLAAMSLPAELESRRRLSRRSEEEILVAVARPFQTNASLLDARGVNATARSRGHQSIEKELRRHSFDAGDYFAMATTGDYSAPRVKADIIELVRAVHDGRWETARHILAVASSPLWREGPSATVDVGALKIEPEMVTDPTARAMIENAVRTAADRSPVVSSHDGAEPDAVDAISGAPIRIEVHEHANTDPHGVDAPSDIKLPSPTRHARMTAGHAAFGLAGVAALATVVALLIRGVGDGNDASTVEIGGARVVLRVYNRVTNGPSGMREDASPVQLTRQPRPFCKAATCIAGTARTTGQIYEYAICETIGDIPAMTNGNLSTDTSGRGDNHNPDLYSSRTYYGVRLKNGITGYVSDVWVAPAQRAGKLSLPRCPANLDDS
jgi:hypothetical protein